MFNTRMIFICIFAALLIGCQKESPNELLPTMAVIVPSIEGQLPGIPIEETRDLNEDDLLPIDQASDEIDQSVCQEAVTMWADLLVMEAGGEDMSELKTAVLELVAELPNCVIPTPEP